MLNTCVQPFDVTGNLEKFCNFFFNSTGPKSESQAEAEAEAAAAGQQLYRSLAQTQGRFPRWCSLAGGGAPGTVGRSPAPARPSEASLQRSTGC
jgi:hypothetical protein